MLPHDCRVSCVNLTNAPPASPRAPRHLRRPRAPAACVAPGAHSRVAPGRPATPSRRTPHPASSRAQREISRVATMVWTHRARQGGHFGSCDRVGPPSATPPRPEPAAIRPGILPICIRMHISRIYALDFAKPRFFRNLAKSFCDYAIIPDFSEDFWSKTAARRIRDRHRPR